MHARLSNKREVLKYIYEYRFLGSTYFASSFGPELPRCERPGRNNVHSTQFLKGALITSYSTDRFHNQRRRRYRIYPLIERAIAQPHPLVSSSFSFFRSCHHCHQISTRALAPRLTSPLVSSSFFIFFVIFIVVIIS